ncbi:AraC family transcriptional regulator [Stappia sp.]|uniref:AraC family transcriptional regulator n=1 Tax=Stappia sp. TaxID=1870903 RepID=UPI003A99A7F9
MLDLLSDILTRLSLKGTLYFRTSFTPPWGVQVPQLDNVCRFHFAHRGDCMLRIQATGETVLVAQGDLVLIPHGAAHALYCQHTGPAETLPLDEVFEKTGYRGEGVLVHGGDDTTRSTQMICGHFSFAEGSRHLIFDRLPSCIHVRDYGAESGAWMEATLRVIGGEAGSTRLGGDLIALKMSEAIFAQAIRTWLERQADDGHNLAGFADPQISRALTAFHRDPAGSWSVESLARAAGLSRTSFAQHFARKMGVTPMQYVTDWRMQIARQGLAERKLNVSEAAALAGYASDSAFSRVFKKEVGVSPASFRTAR